MPKSKEIKRIAAIHDMSGVGKCSLTVALPVISASGVECSCMPTAILSTHTAVFTGYTVRDLSEDMLPMARHWKKENIRFDGLYSGYMISPKQGEIISECFDILSNDDTLIIVDPVMADNGSYYAGMGEEMCKAFRKLCSRASIITPNVTEACYLTETPYVEGVHSEEYINTLVKKLGTLGAKTVILTGVCPQEEKIGNVALDVASGEIVYCYYDRLETLYHGTGDLFGSALSALLVRGASLETAIDNASYLVMEAMKLSEEQNIPSHMGVNFENVLPSYVARINELL